MYLLLQCDREQELNQDHTFFFQNHLQKNQTVGLSCFETFWKNIAPSDGQYEI